MSFLQILAPFAGWCSNLDQVPDPVFAGRMLGDGVAIDPTMGSLLAPCAGEIVTLSEGNHSLSIRSSLGIEIFVHIGVDTVELGGRGFEALIRRGATVRAGDELIRFDLDMVARGARSLMTPILVQSDGVTLQEKRAPGAVAAGDLLFVVSQLGAAAAAASTDHIQSRVVTMALRRGLHARPAALVAQRAKSISASVALQANGRKANARSMVALLALGVRHGDRVTIEAAGEDAARAIDTIQAALAEALRLESSDPESAAAAVPQNNGARASPRARGELHGTAAVAGYAVGRATRIERHSIEVAERGEGADIEYAELERARDQARMRLRITAAGSATRRAIVLAHLEFLDDPSLNSAARESIALGKSAGFAWRSAIRQSIDVLRMLDDSRLRERAHDLLAVEAHVLLALPRGTRPMSLPIPEQAVLIAEDLLPSELTVLDRRRLVAICLADGSATSHAAILAAAMEVPMLVGLGPSLHEVAAGTAVIVDADGGRLLTAASETMIEEARARVEAAQQRSASRSAAAQADCYAQDGTRVQVFANLSSESEAAVAVENGAEGCGLLRTEFLFLDRDSAPGEDEQYSAYQVIAAALGNRPLLLRLMDVGGDKPLRYLPLPAHDNPALGLRGVRAVLARPDLLRTQLRAALRVQPAGQLRLLVPMVTDAAEILAVRAVVDALKCELAVDAAIQVGAMIETPAAALTAAQLLRCVDFLSIGSNDLTQYTLAMDRGHPQLATQSDALHPAVLKLIAATASAGMNAGKLVAVCGGMASDRMAVPVLLGLGVREFSVVPGAIPAIKSRLRSLRVLDCRALALRCLDLGSAAEVRALIARTFPL
jgi:multiphosphoryl transfer protein